MADSFRCGKCGSRMLYRDNDVVNKDDRIACRKCGNRWPGGQKPVFVQSEETTEGVDMRGTCLNCERPDMGLNNGLCGTCNAAATKLIGEARAQALAKVKERIQSGGLQRKPAGRLLQKEGKNIPQSIPPKNAHNSVTSDVPAPSETTSNDVKKQEETPKQQPYSIIPAEINLRIDVFLHFSEGK